MATVPKIGNLLVFSCQLVGIYSSLRDRSILERVSQSIRRMNPHLLITHLTLSGRTCSNEQLATLLAKCPKLIELGLSLCRFESKAFLYLPPLNQLQICYLSYATFPSDIDVELERIASLPNLRRIVVVGCSVSEATREKFQRSGLLLEGSQTKRQLAWEV